MPERTSESAAHGGRLYGTIEYQVSEWQADSIRNNRYGDELEARLEESRKEYNVSVLYGSDLYRRLNSMLMGPELQGRVEEDI